MKLVLLNKALWFACLKWKDHCCHVRPQPQPQHQPQPQALLLTVTPTQFTQCKMQAISAICPFLNPLRPGHSHPLQARPTQTQTRTHTLQHCLQSHALINPLSPTVRRFAAHSTLFIYWPSLSYQNVYGICCSNFKIIFILFVFICVTLLRAGCSFLWEFN